MNSNNVYSIIFNAGPIAPGVIWNTTFSCDNWGQAFEIKSINLDYRMGVYVAGHFTNWLPVEQNTTQSIALAAYGQVAGDLIARPVMNLLPLVGMASINGGQFSMFRPGQVFFNSWYVKHQIHFTFQYINMDLINDYAFEAHVSVEIGNIEKL